MMQDFNKGTRLPGGSDDEIALKDVFRFVTTVRKRKKMIIYLVIILITCTAVGSLFMTDIYEAKAVIAPVASTQGVSSALSSLSQQFSGIASLAGISLPGGSSTAEVTSLLNSTVVREKVITENNLLPVIFADKWDNEKKEWKKPNMFLMALYRFKSFLKSSRPGESKISVGDPWVPTTWDGLRELGDDGDIITVTSDDKAGTVSITARMDDPEMAAKLVSYFITTLTDHMSGEARRVAETNRRYLEGQLSKAADPAIRQKIYALMSQHVETLLMAEVKENYAFKVLDPPKAPDEKIKPKRGRMVVLSFMLALFLGVVAALVLEFLEKQKELINVDAAALKEQKPEPLTIFEAERNKTQRSREMYQE